MLMNDDIKQMSMGALNQLNLDLLQCERKFLLYQESLKIILCIFRICGFGTSKGVTGGFFALVF